MKWMRQLEPLSFLLVKDRVQEIATEMCVYGEVSLKSRLQWR
jgi:hypothetical protein